MASVNRPRLSDPPDAKTCAACVFPRPSSDVAWHVRHGANPCAGSLPPLKSRPPYREWTISSAGECVKNEDGKSGETVATHADSAARPQTGSRAPDLRPTRQPAVAQGRHPAAGKVTPLPRAEPEAAAPRGTARPPRSERRASRAAAGSPPESLARRPVRSAAAVTRPATRPALVAPVVAAAPGAPRADHAARRLPYSS